MYGSGSMLDRETKEEFKTAGYYLKWGGIAMGILGVLYFTFGSTPKVNNAPRIQPFPPASYSVDHIVVMPPFWNV